MRRPLLVVATTTVLMVIAGCSSSKPKAAGTTGSSASAGGASAGVSAALASEVDALLAPPTSVGVTQPLSAKPPTGKYLIILNTPQAVRNVEAAGQIAAAKALGWRAETISEGTGPEDAGKAFNLALAKHPDMIEFSGSPAESLQPQLAAAAAQGVIVVADSIGDAKTGGALIGTVDGGTQVNLWGQQVAKFVAVKSQGKAHVALITITAYPSLVSFDDGFDSALKAACAACTIKLVNQQVADVGTKTPTSVVSTLQADPSINWVIFSFGDLTIGVGPALRAAGLSSKVSIGGETPSLENVAALKAGTEAVWAGFPAAVVGWRAVDLFARHYTKDSLDTAQTAPLPSQLLTPDNVNQAATDSSGYFVGFKDYAAQFETLWKIS